MFTWETKGSVGWLGHSAMWWVTPLIRLRLTMGQLHVLWSRGLRVTAAGWWPKLFGTGQLCAEAPRSVGQVVPTSSRLLYLLHAPLRLPDPGSDMAWRLLLLPTLEFRSDPPSSLEPPPPSGHTQFLLKSHLLSELMDTFCSDVFAPLFLSLFNQNSKNLPRLHPSPMC